VPSKDALSFALAVGWQTANVKKNDRLREREVNDFYFGDVFIKNVYSVAYYLA